MRHGLCAAAVAALLLQGCSSRPRSFVPVLAAPPADQAAYEAHLQACQVRIATGGWKHGRGASAAGGAAIGTGAGVAAGAAASAAATPTMIGAAAATAAAAAMAVPVFGVLGAWGISKIKKSKNERAVKSRLGECLAEGGYPVERWRALSKKELRELRALEPALDCSVGPLARSFGGQPWLVYSCADRKSIVVASAPGNPASPFYFHVRPAQGGFDVAGQGSGSTEATAAAFEDLKALGESDITAIIAATRRR